MMNAACNEVTLTSAWQRHHLTGKALPLVLPVILLHLRASINYHAKCSVGL